VPDGPVAVVLGSAAPTRACFLFFCPPPHRVAFLACLAWAVLPAAGVDRQPAPPSHARISRPFILAVWPFRYYLYSSGCRVNCQAGFTPCHVFALSTDVGVLALL